jgi:hypothetical protein
LIKGAASFGREKRLKTESGLAVGPGSYEKFSVFGTLEDK